MRYNFTPGFSISLSNMHPSQKAEQFYKDLTQATAYENPYMCIFRQN